MKCDLILNETLQGGVQPDYAAQWAQYYRSQVVLFDNLGHILGKPSRGKSDVFLNIVQTGGGGSTHVQKFCRKLSFVLEVI